LPPVGADIITNTGRARVLAQEILAGQLLIETEDMRRIVVDAADVLTVLQREKKPRGGDAATTEGVADEPASEQLPHDLAVLEDTVFRDADFRPESLSSEADDSGDSNGRSNPD
jgi:hypothetical protein